MQVCLSYIHIFVRRNFGFFRKIFCKICNYVFILHILLRRCLSDLLMRHKHWNGFSNALLIKYGEHIKCVYPPKTLHIHHYTERYLTKNGIALAWQYARQKMKHHYSSLTLNGYPIYLWCPAIDDTIIFHVGYKFLTSSSVSVWNRARSLITILTPLCSKLQARISCKELKLIYLHWKHSN